MPNYKLHRLFHRLCFIASCPLHNRGKIQEDLLSFWRDQITLNQSKIMCVVVIVDGSILSIPICIFYGKRTLELENNITATRCSVLNKFDCSFPPIAHFGFLNVCSLIVVITIVVIQLKNENGYITTVCIQENRLGSNFSQK